MKSLGIGELVCAVTLFCAATITGSSAQSFTRLTKFDGANGAWPTYGSLIQSVDGNFYGTTSFGGNSNRGTIFKITPNGRVTTLYSFCPQTGCADGSVPYGGLVQTVDGDLYGTTYEGGPLNDGTVFELSPKDGLSTIHTFCSEANCSDGVLPYAGLVPGIDGDFYGVTSLTSGAKTTYGIVFEIGATGQFTTLYTFCSRSNCIDGSLAKGVILANSGRLYGTTPDGGADKVGTVFEMTPDGKLTTIHSFNKSDGEYPNTLIQAADGNLYGTTLYGGANGSGVAFKITPTGQFTLLYSFCSLANCADGGGVNAPLMQGTDGNFYGTTTFGGTVQINGPFAGYGTVFQITPAGVLTTLHTFCLQGGDCEDGSYPEAGLTQGTDGNFYGTTYGRPQCPGSCGTVFRLSMGLGPFVEASPNFAPTGRPVNILGNNLTGTTSVTFNGVPATFKVVSSTFIKATVPSGATGGTIQVTTPNGTLNSNVAFHVLQ